MDMVEWVHNNFPGAILMNGYDDCIIGICNRFGQEPIVLYDQNKVIQKLMDDGMSGEEALEYFEFNQIGAWMGDRTPAFLLKPE